jgi:hypothetical protein
MTMQQHGPYTCFFMPAADGNLVEALKFACPTVILSATQAVAQALLALFQVDYRARKGGSQEGYFRGALCCFRSAGWLRVL